MSFTRKMFRILTCLFKKRGLFSILVQNSLKVTKKVLVFRKVARSCSLTKKLLKILKVAKKKLPSRIWKGLAQTSECYHNSERLLHFQVLTLTSTSLGDQEHFVNLLVLYQCCQAKSRY